MKFFIVTLALLALAAAKPQDEKYTTKYSSIDIDEILQSDRLFKNYYNCLMETGACSPLGRGLRVLPDALESNCSKCSEKQRESVIKTIKFLIENRPEEWKALKAKYDPEDKYEEKNVFRTEKEGIKL